MQQPLPTDEDGIGRKEINRIVDRFLALGELRLQRIQATLTHDQRSFFDLLPLLFHINHPTLPGFLSSKVPAGVMRFEPTREQILLARRYVRGFKPERRPHKARPIRGLYLMGSMGSLGQAFGSDFDFWLCHGGDVDDRGRRLLREKAALLEVYAGDLGLNAHFFLMHAESFRDGATEQLSKESSGHTQHTLLLEEFYRTGIRLAGNPVLWWAVPPQQESDYAGYTGRLVKQRFIRPDHWLDFGGLQRLPADEFFGVAHWQLFKGIDAPYKSLLKLMLLEAYAAEYPCIDWLCMETKRAVYGSEDKPDADRLDPYGLILERITRYLDARNEPARLRLARRAFYFKAGQALTRPQNRDWRHHEMVAQCRNWGWHEPELQLLDRRPEWKLDRVLDERNALVSELSRSYRLLTEFAREQDGLNNINGHELALLGRKLYAALDKRPGKIDRVNPGISRDLAERTLWLKRTDGDPVHWQLYRHTPDEDDTPTKTSASLVEILAWLHLNGICDRGTLIQQLPKARGYSDSEQDKILRTLRKLIPRDMKGQDSLEAYSHAARGAISLWFVNVANNPFAQFTEAGYQLISERVDALSFGAAHECLVLNVEHLYSTTWGEVRVERYQDGADGLLDALCRYLDLFAPHAYQPGRVAAFSFSSPRGAAIANRVSRLARETAQLFHRHGKALRFMLRIGDSFYQIDHQEGGYQWRLLGNQRLLEDQLGDVQGRFQPTRIDSASLKESALPLVLTHNEPDKVQVFYEVKQRAIELFVLDEHGALFHQIVEDADEYQLMVQQQRFLDTVASRRLLTLDTAEADLTPHYARIEQRRTGEWFITPIRVPRTQITDHLELVLLVNAGFRLEDGFRLRLGDHEFDSLELGEGLYTEVARQIKVIRRGGSRYPVYLTGVLGSEGDTGASGSLVALLRLKQRLESRLSEAMR